MVPLRFPHDKCGGIAPGRSGVDGHRPRQSTANSTFPHGSQRGPLVPWNRDSPVGGRWSARPRSRGRRSVLDAE